MNQRAASRVAWSLWVLTVIVSAASLLLVYLIRGAPVRDVIGFRGFEAVLAVVFASVGAMVAARRSSNPVGWLLLAFGFGNALVSLLQQYAFYALIRRSAPLGGGALAAWGQEVLGVAQGAIFILFLLLFPTGRLPSARWRTVAVMAVASSILESLGAAFMPGRIQTLSAKSNPFGFGGDLGLLVAAVDLAGNVLFVTSLLAAVVSVVLRYRRAERIERQQLKWIAASTALVGLGLVGFVLTGQEAGGSALARPVQVFLILAIIAVPLAAGVAILRHRLYDIDRIISRTFSYAIVTTILGGVFALVVVVPALVVGAGDVPGYFTAIATVAVAALFRPMRRRVQGAVDRRFNRDRYDAARTLETFAAHLRQGIDIDSMRAELTGAVAQTMHPARVSLWLRNEA